MCGRYGSIKSTAILAERFAAEAVPAAEERPPSWNVAPTQPIRAVLERADRGRLLVALRWGLVPHWAKDPGIGNRLINARAESLGTKAAFRSALARRRCLIPADGFYEWARRDDGTKRGRRVPYWFTRGDGDVLALAGLWETWKDAEGELWRTATIVTTEASADLAAIHDRMPLVLEPQDWEEWLAPEEKDPDDLAHLLAPAPAGTLVRHRVPDLVNRPTEDGPELIEPVPEDAEAPRSGGREPPGRGGSGSPGGGPGRPRPGPRPG